ncbi:MAG: hypothetical protein JWN70_2115, partial [Planctomycetaceae bacterium]|nr:hypothetical protein [Planctomycetaceae bacterium]
MKTRWVAVVLCLTYAGQVWSAPPRIGGINPPVVQRGVEGKLQFYGKALKSGTELVLPFKADVRLEGGGEEAFNVIVKPSPDTLPGAYPVRVRTTEGISNIRLLVVADVPVIRVVEPNGRYKNGALDLVLTQPVQWPCIIAGDRLAREIDAFRFEVKAGDRLTFVTETWRVGLTPEPLLRLRDRRGRMLAYAHDTPTLQRDERLDFTYDTAGENYLEIQSTGEGGGWNNHYLVQVGPSDYARHIFPLGGRRGDKVGFQIVNRDGQTRTLEATIPSDPWNDSWRLPLPDHPGSLP